MLPYIIAVYLKAEGISERTLADIIGIDHNCLNRFVNDKQISLKSASKIVAWLLSPKPE